MTMASRDFMPSVGFTVLKFEVCKANGSAPPLNLRGKLGSCSCRKVTGNRSLAVCDYRVNGRVRKS